LFLIQLLSIFLITSSKCELLLRFRSSFICQGTSTRRQRSDLCGLRVKLHQSNHSKVEAIPLSALPKDTTSELAGLSPHQPF